MSAIAETQGDTSTTGQALAAISADLARLAIQEENAPTPDDAGALLDRVAIVRPPEHCALMTEP